MSDDVNLERAAHGTDRMPLKSSMQGAEVHHVEQCSDLKANNLWQMKRLHITEERHLVFEADRFAVDERLIPHSLIRGAATDQISLTDT